MFNINMANGYPEFASEAQNFIDHTFKKHEHKIKQVCDKNSFFFSIQVFQQNLTLTYKSILAKPAYVNYIFALPRKIIYNGLKTMSCIDVNNNFDINGNIVFILDRGLYISAMLNQPPQSEKEYFFHYASAVRIYPKGHINLIKTQIEPIINDEFRNLTFCSHEKIECRVPAETNIDLIREKKNVRNHLPGIGRWEFESVYPCASHFLVVFHDKNEIFGDIAKHYNHCYVRDIAVVDIEQSENKTKFIYAANVIISPYPIPRYETEKILGNYVQLLSAAEQQLKNDFDDYINQHNIHIIPDKKLFEYLAATVVDGIVTNLLEKKEDDKIMFVIYKMAESNIKESETFSGFDNALQPLKFKDRAQQKIKWETAEAYITDVRHEFAARNIQTDKVCNKFLYFYIFHAVIKARNFDNMIQSSDKLISIIRNYWPKYKDFYEKFNDDFRFRLGKNSDEKFMQIISSDTTFFEKLSWQNREQPPDSASGGMIDIKKNNWIGSIMFIALIIILFFVWTQLYVARHLNDAYSYKTHSNDITQHISFHPPSYGPPYHIRP